MSHCTTSTDRINPDLLNAVNADLPPGEPPIRLAGTASATVTLLTRTDNKPAGKTYKADGSKPVEGHAGRYSAQTVAIDGTPDQILDGYRQIVETLAPSQIIVLGAVESMGMSAYRIVPKTDLTARGLAEDGIHLIDGVPTCARIKQHFAPSRIQLLDFDPDAAMPSAWRDAGEQGRWDLFTTACPEFEGAARLTIPSGSGRVLNAAGEHLKPEAERGSHTYVVLDRDITTDALDNLRTTLEVRLWANHLGFCKPSASGAALKRALYDSSVFVAGREVFDGPPAVEMPYRLAPLTANAVPGGFAGVLAPLTDDEMRIYGERTGARVVRVQAHPQGGVQAHPQGGVRFTIEDHTLLKMGTTIITERGPLTVRQFLESGADKLRCQATFRASSSFAGILRRVGNTAILHDVGENKTYRIGSDQSAIPSGLIEALEELKKQHPANAQGYARAILLRQAWRCPVTYSFTALVRAISDSHPAVDRDDLEALASWLEAKAKKAAKSAVEIDAKAIPRNVIIHRIADIGAAKAGIESIGAGVHLVKAPHGSGKTEHLLRPIALCSHDVLAIAPRVSLVSALSKRLELHHYQEGRGAQNLAICINSIVHPGHSFSVRNSRVVLVDEIARVVRECHNPASTMKKTARAVWDELTSTIERAALTVGVDADVSTNDVRMLAQSIDSPIHLWIVSETARDLAATFVHHDQTIADTEAAIEAGGRVLFIADSAERVASLASEWTAKYPHLNIVAIHNRKGLATTGTEAVQAILRDIDQGVLNVDVLLLSPAVESGVSLNIPHFTHHFAQYFGVVEPSSFNQMLLRDRTATHWTIGIVGNGFQNRPDSLGEILNGMDAAQRRVSALADEPEGFGTIAPKTEFDRDCCRTMAAAASARNRYAADLFYLLEARGWTCTRGSQGPSETGKAIRKAGKESLRAEALTAILTAPDAPAAEIETLRESHRVTPEQSAIIARADVREASGIVTGALDTEAVDTWQGGKLASQIKLIEDLSADVGASQRDRDDASVAVPVALRSYDGARGEAVRALFDALGIDRETGAGTITAATALAAFEALKGTDQGKVLSHFGICRFNRKPARPVQWAGDALRRFGLWLAPAKRGRFALGSGVQRDKGGEFRLPGWDLMIEIRNRRSPKTTSRTYRDIKTARCREPMREAA